MMPGLAVGMLAIISPGSATFDVPGTYSFEIPPHNFLTAEVLGASGSGGWTFNNNGRAPNGQDSSFDGTLIGRGGQGGMNRGGDIAAAGGTASGGTTNLTGSDGEDRGPGYAGAGGDGAGPWGGDGGGRQYLAGDPNQGTAPGGGPSGVCTFDGVKIGSGGGAGGGYASKTFASGVYMVGSSVVIIVGDTGGGFNPGTRGEVRVSWS